MSDKAGVVSYDTYAAGHSTSHVTGDGHFAVCTRTSHLCSNVGGVVKAGTCYSMQTGQWIEGIAPKFGDWMQ